MPWAMPVAVPWQCQGIAMAVPWQSRLCHGTVPWHCHCMAVPWQWQCHGSGTATGMAEPGMAVPWQRHGNAMALPWNFTYIYIYIYLYIYYENPIRPWLSENLASSAVRKSFSWSLVSYMHFTNLLRVLSWAPWQCHHGNAIMAMPSWQCHHGSFYSDLNDECGAS